MSVQLGDRRCQRTSPAQNGGQCAYWVAILIFAAGCRSPDSEPITSQLWRDKGLNSEFAPAPNADVQLFQNADCADVLVVYTEARDGMHFVRRAYFVRQDGDRVDGGSDQDFVSPDLASKMKPIPLAATPMSDGQHARWARLSADGRYFTLFAGNKMLDSYILPNYFKRNTFKRLLLTPFAVAADMSIPTTDSLKSIGNKNSDSSSSSSTSHHRP